MEAGSFIHEKAGQRRRSMRSMMRVEKSQLASRFLLCLLMFIVHCFRWLFDRCFYIQLHCYFPSLVIAGFCSIRESLEVAFVLLHRRSIARVRSELLGSFECIVCLLFVCFFVCSLACLLACSPARMLLHRRPLEQWSRLK